MTLKNWILKTWIHEPNQANAVGDACSWTWWPSISPMRIAHEAVVETHAHDATMKLELESPWSLSHPELKSDFWSEKPIIIGWYISWKTQILANSNLVFLDPVPICNTNMGTVRISGIGYPGQATTATIACRNCNLIALFLLRCNVKGRGRTIKSITHLSHCVRAKLSQSSCSFYMSAQRIG